MSIENPNFLKKKYDLHKSDEVDSAAERTQKRTGEKVPQKPEARIQNYLQRFKEITEREDPTEKQRGLDALKFVLHKNLVIKPEDIPESYFQNQQRLAREQGHGDIEIGEAQRQQLTEVIIADQESSMDNWIDYLSSDDALYPDWLKYYAFRSILSLSTFDKDKKEFGKRGKGTAAPFPDLNREALAYVLDAIEKKYDKNTSQIDSLEPEEKQKFAKLLQGENFGKLYAWAIEKVTPAEAEQLTITTGQWKKYDQGSDHMPLVQSLQGHGTGWCTAGESTAQAQLQSGDFYVYYSHDQDGQAAIPRVAIRMEDDHIAEVRGIAHEQNLDPYIGEVVDEKLEEFGEEGRAYQKKSADMQKLTAIDNKVQSGEELTKEDLRFLYEIDQPIEGFGYQKDPRIEELRKTRSPEQDAPIVLECTSEQIAHTEIEVNENTKAYIGPLFPRAFTQLENIQHIYTSFPEGKIGRSSIIIGTSTKEEIKDELEQSKVTLEGLAQGALDNPGFTTANQPEEIELVSLRLIDLDFYSNSKATTSRIFHRASVFGLDLCPTETGPHLSLKKDLAKKLGNNYSIAMEQISIDPTHDAIFYIDHSRGESILKGITSGPNSIWFNPYATFIFKIRKTPKN